MKPFKFAFYILMLVLVLACAAKTWFFYTKTGHVLMFGAVGLSIGLMGCVLFIIEALKIVFENKRVKTRSM